MSGTACAALWQRQRSPAGRRRAGDFAASRQRGVDGGIVRKLEAMPEGQTFATTSMRCYRNVKVHVGELDVSYNRGASFRQIRATACLRGSARGEDVGGGTGRACGRGVQCSVAAHLCSASGRDRRRRRSRRTRNCALRMAMSSRVGMRFSAREAKSPACDSARDVPATCRRRGLGQWAGAVAAPEQRSTQAGASKPRSHRCARAWVAAAVEGRAPSPCKDAQPSPGLWLG